MSRTWALDFLNQLIQKEKLIIREDELFIRNLLSSLPKNLSTSRQSLIILNFSLMWIALIAICILPKTLITISTIAVSVITFVTFLNAEPLKMWWTKRSYKRSLIDTAVGMKGLKTIAKRILKVIEEEEIIELKYPGTTANKLKTHFGLQLKEVFMTTRNICIDIKNIPNSVCKLEDDSCCISQLPIETFEQLLNETDFSSSQLRGLIKLITLQSSEFFRKSMSILILSPDSTASFKMTTPMAKKLTNVIRVQNINLEKEYVYHESLLHAKEPNNLNSTSENFNELESLVNQARAKALTAYVLLKKSAESGADEALTLNTVNSAMKELIVAAEIAQLICDKFSSSTSKVEVSAPLVHPTHQRNANLYEFNTNQDTEDVLDYEVYEADQAGDLTTEVTVDGDDFDFNGKIGISVRMNDDLRCAILKKAEEHQERIAQALHLPVNEVSVNYFSGQEGKEKELVATESKSEERVHETMNQFNSQLLANLVVEGGRRNMNWKEDTFGSSCSSASISDEEEKEDELKCEKSS